MTLMIRENTAACCRVWKLEPAIERTSAPVFPRPPPFFLCIYEYAYHLMRGSLPSAAMTYRVTEGFSADFRAENHFIVVSFCPRRLTFKPFSVIPIFNK